MPLFGKSHKSPTDIVRTLKENLAILVKHDKKTDKVGGVFPSLGLEGFRGPKATGLCESFGQFHVPSSRLQGKKDVCQIFNNILRRQIGTRSPTVEYFCSHQEVLFILLKGYETPQIALNCGIMLRECIRHEPLAKIVLHSEHFHSFFNYVEMSTFDIASDAFATFKDLLTRHKVLVAEFLEQNYDAVFADYEKLLHSENYVTKRQSLKLLGELLLDRHNFTVMTRYISKPENLKLMMNLLRDKSPNIQFEAFHVFKVRIHVTNKTTKSTKTEKRTLENRLMVH
uniref:Calcium binding protein 39-like n=1 Tax=Oryzias melastigma TaxID=30732 RepID=A0A3B3D8H4_ORYME